MNALTTIPANRCPPEYRHLSPKEECRLRSLRLISLGAAAEAPGRLPFSVNPKKGAQTMDMPARQAAILAFLKDGPKRGFEVQNATGLADSATHNALADLALAGLVVYVKEERKRPLWRLAENPPPQKPPAPAKAPWHPAVLYVHDPKAASPVLWPEDTDILAAIDGKWATSADVAARLKRNQRVVVQALCRLRTAKLVKHNGKSCWRAVA